MKRNMRKTGLFFGAVAVALVMLSSVTAVPNVESELLIEEFEEQKNEIIKQLEDLWFTLLNDESLNIAEWQAQNDIDPGQDFEDLFDEEGFLNYIVSDDFINLLKAHLDELLVDEGVLFLFNTDEMQDLLNSEEFLYFANTDEAQYILERLHEDDDSVEEIVGVVGLGAQQTNPLVLEGGLGTDPASCPIENGELELEVEILDYDWTLLDLFMIFIAGVVTWIPIIIYFIMISPMIWYDFFWCCRDEGLGVISSLIIGLLGTIAFITFMAGVWPFFFVYWFMMPPPV